MSSLTANYLGPNPRELAASWLPSAYICLSASIISTKLRACILTECIWKLMPFPSTRGSSKMSLKGKFLLTNDKYQMSKQWYFFKILECKNVFYFIMFHKFSSHTLILPVWFALSNITSKDIIENKLAIFLTLLINSISLVHPVQYYIQGHIIQNRPAKFLTLLNHIRGCNTDKPGNEKSHTMTG